MILCVGIVWLGKAGHVNIGTDSLVMALAVYGLRVEEHVVFLSECSIDLGHGLACGPSEHLLWRVGHV